MNGMKVAKSAIVAVVFMVCVGCTMQNIREGLCRGVYEGARIENNREMTPADRAGKPIPDYNQYSNQRKERGGRGE